MIQQADLSGLNNFAWLLDRDVTNFGLMAFE